MYESPITQIIADISSQIREAQDGHLIYEVQQAIGYKIDKEELIKALKYDRDQYQKGYEDGRKDNEWTPVVAGDLTTLPKPYENVLVQYGSSMYVVYLFIDTSIKHNEDNDNSGWCNDELGYLCDVYEVEAWKPLPEPYKEEE